MMYRILIMVLMCILMRFGYNASAQTHAEADPEKDTALVDKDIVDTIVRSQTFSASGDSIQSYKKRQEFAYIYYIDSLLRKSNLKTDTIDPSNFDIKTQKNSTSYNQRLHNETKVNIFDNGFIRVLLWLLATGFIGVILYKLFLGESLFKKKLLKAATPGKEEEIISDPLIYDKLIFEAIENKSFRLATRYLYIKALKSLVQAGVVHFASEKTNERYIKDLEGKSYQADFASLTRSYEYVWYGRFKINEDNFTNLYNRFNEFYQKSKY